MSARVGCGALTLMLLSSACTSGESAGAAPGVVVGSKAFTESVILGEVMAGAFASTGARVEHRRQLGGSLVLWNALLADEIDAYVEYTGTLGEEIFGGRVATDLAALRQAVTAEGLRISAPLGFANTYAIGMLRQVADALGIETISDLASYPELQLGFSEGFMQRQDAWPGLRARYSLPHRDVRGLNHDLAYRALEAGELEVTDLYSTDAEIRHYDLRILTDDRDYFPDYRAVILYRAELESWPAVVDVIERLQGSIDTASMVEMNAASQIERQPETDVANRFLQRQLGVAADRVAAGFGDRLWDNTLDHLGLVIVSLAAAILVALPLGMLASRRPRLGRFVLSATGILQTIPSLALLVFLIPPLGIGAPPAIVALFLYSLLPIVRNTATGLTSIPRGLLESADALGLPRGARLWRVELPLASRPILAGIKTAAVINVGTATLGALIGAGGYGQPILAGIRLNNTALILEGAIPAAVLALFVQGAFDLLERLIVPRGLRL